MTSAGPPPVGRVRPGRPARNRSAPESLSPEPQPPERLRVLIADDQAVVRLGFTALIDSQDDMAVVGSAADGQHAVRLAARA